ncbi:hypothetical protein [Mucilaginibacter pedocola]|uniref:Uncharacterized protein n=1 Tax=Mucilaginibacter pedocola TaxID=1792845 RepID=A0A1S9P8L6_9SPHI|nr:hypothetical protein [Mucilaginibacter pedocola]OOQ57310.1 hypothetical protein BC343_14445 [Mucilaginibacter pedocola]
MALPEYIEYTPPLPELTPYITIFASARMTVTEGSDSVDIFPVGYSVLSFALDDLLQDFLDKDKTLPHLTLPAKPPSFTSLG